MNVMAKMLLLLLSLLPISFLVKNIWKSYIWTADKDVNESDPRSNVHYLGSSENKAWKKKKKASGLSSAHYCEDHFHFNINIVFINFTLLMFLLFLFW